LAPTNVKRVRSIAGLRKGSTPNPLVDWGQYGCAENLGTEIEVIDAKRLALTGRKEQRLRNLYKRNLLLTYEGSKSGQKKSPNDFWRSRGRQKTFDRKQYLTAVSSSFDSLDPVHRVRQIGKENSPLPTPDDRKKEINRIEGGYK